MAVTFDAASVSSETDITPLTWSHTVNAGSDNFLVVGVAIRDADVTVSTMTFGSQSLTKIRHDELFEQTRSEVWRLINPTEQTATITVNFVPDPPGETAGMTGGACSFFGVDQTTPIANDNGGTGTSLTPSVTVNSSTDNFVMDNAAVRNVFTTLTADSPQVERYKVIQTESIGGSTDAGASPNVTMSWTGTEETAGEMVWAISAVDIAAVAVAAAVYPPFPRRQRTTVRM